MNENSRNYQKELDAKIADFEDRGEVPTLLLHSCCGPCSSYCIEYLSNYFHITVFYYNPNITEQEEYNHRVQEQMRLIDSMPTKYPVSYVGGAYEPEKFYAMAEGLEDCKEGGERCFGCYDLRLLETAKKAKELGLEYFTTTLTISPMKSSKKLNEIGERIGEGLGVKFLNSDFKKKNGYKRSIELSREYNLYRQNFCGCSYSKQEMEEREARKREREALTGEVSKSVEPVCCGDRLYELEQAMEREKNFKNNS